MINVKSGGRTRIAGIAAALFLLAFILVGSSVIEKIPLAALVGVMFMVVIGTFAWNSLKILRKVPLKQQVPLKGNWNRATLVPQVLGSQVLARPPLKQELDA